jgi:hypothetical protein
LFICGVRRSRIDLSCRVVDVVCFVGSLALIPAPGSYVYILPRVCVLRTSHVFLSFLGVLKPGYLVETVGEDLS